MMRSLHTTDVPLVSLHAGFTQVVEEEDWEGCGGIT